MNKSIAFASAGHDVRASLAGISGLIKLCYDVVSLDSDLARNLDQMNSCVEKLLGILNSVLDISKVEAGKMHLEEVEFNVAQAIEESVDIFHIVALAKGLEVIWDPCDFSVLLSSNVRGDCLRFKQILDNLLSNAVKFTSEGHIVVRAWVRNANSKYSELTSVQNCKFFDIFGGISKCFQNTEDNSQKESHDVIHHIGGDKEFIFEVDDTGMGIPTEKRASVFENYVQVKDSNLGYEGTGLGLGIVQSFVRLMGGDIIIQDKEPGERGSCFRFNIYLKSSEISSDNTEVEDSDLQKGPRSYSLHSASSKSWLKLQSNIQNMSTSQGINVDGISCLLLINGVETKKILQTWMGSLGIKLVFFQQLENLYEIMKKITQNYSNSSSSEPSLESANDEFSSHRDDNRHVLPLSLKDVFKRSGSRRSHKYLLFILDLSSGNLQEWISFLDYLRKRIHHFYQYKVVCLYDFSTSTFPVSCDLMLRKPLHGSRIHKILSLMREFGQKDGESVVLSHIVEVPRISSEIETKSLLNSSSHKPEILLQNFHEKLPLVGMNILLVEDTDVLRMVATNFLLRSGATVKSVDNGLQALNVVKMSLQEANSVSTGGSKCFPFDFILMDCQMPIMDGFEATRCIRNVEKQYGLHIPIFALTAYAESDEAEKVRLAGMDFHLIKPIKISKLLEAIKLVIKN
ncbi:Histidine kinase CKI1 [Apostasia shenzhenica]|uniref:histidine kinase n=1 Tax=Apostasia shenzhenica TaxID=1088818 RepID=A0A2I0B685_9ASPA|nr:Histidine kinase CKI1 [Apostasia shenzhenica]